MSHQSGIGVTDGLRDAYMTARSEGKRILKVKIQDETLVEAGLTDAAGTEQEDFGLIPGLLNADEPCYLLFHRDCSNSYGREWILFTFVPDRAKVFEKMLYASTRASLKKELGDTYFTFDIHGTEAEDFTYDAFTKYQAAQKSDAPLTEAERQTRHETSQAVDTGGRSTGVHGVAFPMSDAARDALSGLRDAGNNYVSLKLDIVKETVELVAAENTTVDALSSLVPGDEPRYHIFKYTHDHKGETQSPIVFTYSCPMVSKIKERMMYSSVKAGIMHQLKELSIEVSTKLEVESADELTADYINGEVHPPEPEAAPKKQAFARPVGPGGRGGRRRPERRKD